MVKYSLYNRIQIVAAALAIVFASTGFMFVLESRCPMMNETVGSMSEPMSCCEVPASIPQGQPIFESTVRCNVTTLAGLPSTLISTPAQEKSNVRTDVQLHNYVVFDSHSEIRNPQSEIPLVDRSSLLRSSRERYVLSSAFLL